jgi:hypothetical protein
MSWVARAGGSLLGLKLRTVIRQHKQSRSFASYNAPNNWGVTSTDPALRSDLRGLLT